MAKQKSTLTVQELLRRFLLVGVIIILIVISYFVLIYPTARMALQSRWMPMNWFAGNQNAVVTKEGSSGSGVAYPPMMRDISVGVPSIAPSPITPTTGTDAYLYDKNIQIDQKVIKTANLDIQVDSVPEKINKIQAIAEQRHGFVQNSNVSEDQKGAKYGYITIKVPNDSFQAALNDIRALAIKINSDTTSGQDVTEQYVDLETNLAHYKAVEQQYLDLLKKAKTVDEILKVQDQLNLVQGQIQSIEGQIKYLANQVNYSSITVTLSEQQKVQLPAEKFDWKEVIRQGAISFIKVLQNLFSIIVVAFFVILGLIPYLLFFWLLYWLGRKLYLAIKKRK